MPGSIKNFRGPAVLALTTAHIVVCSVKGVVEVLPLEEISEITVVRFSGIILEQETAWGRIDVPPPGGGYGLEVQFDLHAGSLKGKWKIMTFLRNRADDWESKIREFAFEAHRASKVYGVTDVQEMGGEE